MRVAMKTATYATMHLFVAIAVAYALTHNWKAALAIGVVEPIVQTFAFTIHDRLWTKADERRRNRQGDPSTHDDGRLAAA